MAPYTLFCPICGAKITRDPSDPSDLSKKWLSDISLIYMNPDRQEELPDELPFFIATHARIPRVEGDFPEILDESTGSYKRVESALLRHQAADVDSYCFPIHRGCLGILGEVITSCGISKFPSELVAFLFVLFGELPFDWYQLYWPGEYGGTSEYQRVVKQDKYHIPPRLQYVETFPVESTGLRKLLDEERESLKGNGPEGIETLSNTIPDFIPLPIELAHQILCLLDRSDILTLQKIPSKQVIELPDIFWRDLCDFQEEFGFLGYQENDPSVTSWYEQCLLANRLIKRDLPEIKNRQRIWRLCIDIFGFSTHCALEEAFGIENSPEVLEVLQPEDPTTLLRVQAEDRRQFLTPTLFDGMCTKSSGSIDNIVATGMHVSFKGVGNLRFVSGFKFMPSGKSIGYLNELENTFVSFKSDTLEEYLIMHVAANKFGIVDISVVSSRSLTPEPKWLGGCILTGCAVTRWTVRSGGPTTVISKVVVDMNIVTMTRLQILRPSFMSPTPNPPEETFIQEHLWKPAIPVITTNTSLNHQLFHRTDRKAMIFRDVQPDNTPLPSEFNPLECIHGNETMTRLSFWSTGLHHDICAIEVYTKEAGDTPYVVGRPMGAATDIFVDGEGGEYISGMKIRVVESTGQIATLSVSTSYNRRFEISFEKERVEDKNKLKIRLIDLCPNNTDKVTGFYCRFTQHRPETNLLDIGVITTNHPSPISPQPTSPTPPTPSNSQLTPAFDRKLHAPLRQQVSIGKNWRFLSKASFAGCTRITAYFQIDPPYRLSGICIFGSKSEYPVLPTILGHIGHADTTQTMEFETGEGGVIIKTLDVFYKPLYLHGGGEGKVVVGVKVGVGMNRGRGLGDCSGEAVRLEIGEEDLIQWDYDEVSDYVSVDRYLGTWVGGL
ncbi:hypothetical protein TWF506_008185 [Arthrobotrys conoides]|uniref:F-box domain-containing protein n=1 Tax=Arthrobotrys conoides TaxID=74498 RepID=A0AAN8NNY0_9PEZI